MYFRDFNYERKREYPFILIFVVPIKKTGNKSVSFFYRYALNSRIVSKSLIDSFLLMFPMRKPSDVVSQ